MTLACVGLAEGYLQIIHNGWDKNIVWLRLAQDACQRAVYLDGEYAQAYLQLGEIYIARGDFKQAEREFRTALRFNDKLEKAWSGLGQVFIQYGLYEPCLQVYDKALELNPTAASVSLSRTMILAGLKRYDAAEQEIRRLLQLYPEESHYHAFLALLRYYRGDLNEASTEIKPGLLTSESRPFSHAVSAMILSKQGKLDEALGELELEVKPYVTNDASLAVAVAAVYCLLGRNGQAVEWLNKAVSFGYREYPWLVNDPNFAGLQEDERFIILLDQIRQEWEENMKKYEAPQPI